MKTSPGDFTPQAEAYARARPPYPADLVTLLVKVLEMEPATAVAEIGAGTGIFTRLLTAHPLALTAIEPNVEMRRMASSDDWNGVRWQDGTFEETGLADDSQRWLIAAQAFHWAKPETALPELWRTLRPNGFFTVLWNNRDNDSSPVLTWTRQLIEEMVPNFDEGYRNHPWSEVLTSTGHFDHPFELTVPHKVPMSRARYLDLWRSHNLLNAAAGPERMKAFLNEVESRLADTESIDVPYLCRSWTVCAKA